MEPKPVWEDLTVYHPLKKEELKECYKHFFAIIADNLMHFGFKAKGRMLIKRSGELLHVIQIDTRGSWAGMSDSFKVDIGVTTIYDEECFVYRRELTGVKKIEQIIPKLRNYYRITREYDLLADFLTRKVIEHILPYFEKYETAKQVIANSRDFDLERAAEVSERNSNLILFCELHLHQVQKTPKILDERIAFENRLINDANRERLAELQVLKNNVLVNNWAEIDNILVKRQSAVLKKLKL